AVARRARPRHHARAPRHTRCRSPRRRNFARLITQTARRASSRYCASSFAHSDQWRYMMGLLSFIKDAGEKLFSKGNAQAAMAQAQANPADAEKSKAANDAAGDAILAYINDQNLKATGLTVTFDGATATVTAI